MAYTFADAEAETHKHTQYFDNNGSRGIYHDGWYACTFGPLVPWDAAYNSKLREWDSAKDVWELYDLTKDFSQAENLAGKEPERLAKMKALYLAEAQKNKVFPIGAGIWLRLHPEDRISTSYESWRFDATTTRMPEFAAPGLGRESNHVTIDADLGDHASGVLYALGGASGGLTLYIDDGRLVYEYNMMIIERYIGRSKEKLASGKHKIEVDTTIAKPGAPAAIVLKVDGAEVGQVDVKRTVAGAFTASETLDVGVDLGSPVSLDYFDRRPFAFDGKINSVTVDLK
jgi:arylsulfatase